MIVVYSPQIGCQPTTTFFCAYLRSADQSRKVDLPSTHLSLTITIGQSSMPIIVAKSVPGLPYHARAVMGNPLASGRSLLILYTK